MVTVTPSMTTTSDAGPHAMSAAMPTPGDPGLEGVDGGRQHADCRKLVHGCGRKVRDDERPEGEPRRRDHQQPMTIMRHQSVPQRRCDVRPASDTHELPGQNDRSTEFSLGRTPASCAIRLVMTPQSTTLRTSIQSGIPSASRREGAQLKRGEDLWTDASAPRLWRMSMAARRPLTYPWPAQRADHHRPCCVWRPGLLGWAASKRVGEGLRPSRAWWAASEKGGRGAAKGWAGSNERAGGTASPSLEGASLSPPSVRLAAQASGWAASSGVGGGATRRGAVGGEQQRWAGTSEKVGGQQRKGRRAAAKR